MLQCCKGRKCCNAAMLQRSQMLQMLQLLQLQMAQWVANHLTNAANAAIVTIANGAMGRKSLDKCCKGCKCSCILFVSQLNDFRVYNIICNTIFRVYKSSRYY